MEHPNENTIFQYASEQTTSEEEFQVEAHMAECSECLGRVRALRHLRENFESIWQSWTPAEHGHLYQQWRLATALAQVAESQPSLAQQARQWLGQLRTGVEMAVKVLLDQSRKLAMAAEELLPPQHSFQLQPAIQGVGAGEERERLEGHLNKSRDLLGEGQVEAALQELLHAVEIDARSPQTARSEVHREGRLMLQVDVESRRRELSVRYWPTEDEAAPSLALLVPQDPDVPPQAAAFETEPQARFAQARFSELPDGVFSLWINTLVGDHRRPGGDFGQGEEED